SSPSWGASSSWSETWTGRTSRLPGGCRFDIHSDADEEHREVPQSTPRQQQVRPGPVRIDAQGVDPPAPLDGLDLTSLGPPVQVAEPQGEQRTPLIDGTPDV